MYSTESCRGRNCIWEPDSEGFVGVPYPSNPLALYIGRRTSGGNEGAWGWHWSLAQSFRLLDSADDTWSGLRKSRDNWLLEGGLARFVLARLRISTSGSSGWVRWKAENFVLNFKKNPDKNIFHQKSLYKIVYRKSIFYQGIFQNFQKIFFQNENSPWWKHIFRPDFF